MLFWISMLKGLRFVNYVCLCILWLTIQIFNKLVDMGLSLEISFGKFIVELQIDETIYLFALCCTLRKLTLFFKHKPCDICTNVFNIHVRPLWQAYTNVQLI